MKFAILAISSLSLICSAGTLVIMAKTAKELQAGRVKVETEIETVKTKVARNAAVMKTALAQMEL